jgi:hypothetical protein
MDIEYTFKDIAITLNGKEYFATGYVVVDFHVESDDRSSGYVGGAEIDGFGKIVADLLDEEGETVLSINAKDGPAVDAIFKALDHDSIVTACDDWISDSW